MNRNLFVELEQIVGTQHILHPNSLSPETLQSFCQDWRKRRQGKPLAIVLPKSTKEVAMVVKACAQHNVALVPQGGNTGLVLGGIPDDSGSQIVLSLRRMNQVLELDRENLSLTVQAGTVLQTVQEAAAAQDLLFPLSLSAQGSCTIGGNLATNAGGTQVLRYGTMRDLCLGLEVVTAAGEIWDGLSGLRKDNTGYDLRHLMIGSEGTLGIITAATLKLFPAPRGRATALMAFTEIESVLAALTKAHTFLGSGLTGFEAMGQFALSLVAQHFPNLSFPTIELDYPWYALLETSDNESEGQATQRLQSVLEHLFELGLITDAVLAQNQSQSRALWTIRESIPLAQNAEGLNVKHDISLPISSIPHFILETDALLAKIFEGVRFVNYGHWGDGNLHYNVQCPLTSNPRLFLQNHEAHINSIIYEQVVKFKGSISAEHGIGALKREVLSELKSPVALTMMRAIKSALDPHRILNPGKVI